MIATRHIMNKFNDEDLTKNCQSCMKCKSLKDDMGNIVQHACLVDGQPLGGKWPIHITICGKFMKRK